MEISETIYRHPTLKDGIDIYRLVKACPPLDTNSQYCYHMICHNFSQTCVIAERHAGIVGFILAYLKPEEPGCLFVWQVAVAAKVRGQGLASNMLNWLLNQSRNQHVTHLETTISPSNLASQKLFKHFAKKRHAECQTFPFLEGSCFDDEPHENEILYKIYPIS